MVCPQNVACSPVVSAPRSHMGTEKLAGYAKASGSRNQSQNNCITTNWARIRITRN